MARLPTCLLARLPACLPACLSACLPACLTACLPACQSLIPANTAQGPQGKARPRKALQDLMKPYTANSRGSLTSPRHSKDMKIL